MLDELDALRQAIQLGDYDQALALIDELDEMSRDDKIHKTAGVSGARSVGGEIYHRTARRAGQP